ncbi:hypothetical protein BGZ51_003971 [Haplosporangium sp. Z 767]|nr:hypothetical protein BGZ51_003971 [Haplosporangium sp. Z 767]KAF9195052.1 hypothetical protein BGZ50_005273 [Haplosporangium sp. Z 11]
MSENLDRRSNVRIGLDPIDHGISPYETKNSLTRRSSVGLQIAQVRSVHSVPGKGTYARGALMTEQEMALDLESNPNQYINTSMTSNWPKTPTSVPYRPSNNSSSVIKSPASSHTIYTPPPLPPPGISSPASPKFSRPMSPYADEAMVAFPSSTPSRSASASSKYSSSGLAVMSGRQQPITHTGEGPTGDDDDDEPSVLQLDNTLTVDRYTKELTSAKDRTSVSSFFSTLAIDPEPVPFQSSALTSTSMTMISAGPPVLPEPSFASEEFIIPAPVARIVPVPAPIRAASPVRVPSAARACSPSTSTISTSSSATYIATSPNRAAYDRKQEEIKVAAGFAHDLGFEIVNPSPASSPRHKPATPTDSRPAKRQGGRQVCMWREEKNAVPVD